MKMCYLSAPGILYGETVADFHKMKKITKIVCDYFSISESELISRKQTNKYAYPRTILFYLLKFNTSLRVEYIGRYFGGRHWATVIDAYKKVMRGNKAVKYHNDLNNILNRL